MKRRPIGASCALSCTNPVIGFQLFKSCPELQASAAVAVSPIRAVAVNAMLLRTTVSPPAA